ncbi:hypothetical protein STXM2123_695 [Streptomyces sp. F-3]|nr:hypothetical protein STXM2123_695 [Streptomyces sp. F-3]
MQRGRRRGRGSCGHGWVPSCGSVTGTPAFRVAGGGSGGGRGRGKGGKRGGRRRVRGGGAGRRREGACFPPPVSGSVTRRSWAGPAG